MSEKDTLCLRKIQCVGKIHCLRKIQCIWGYNVSEEDSACRWSQEGPALTLQTLLGQGIICLGKFPLSHQHLCNQIIPTDHSKWIIPPKTGMGACSSVLTPCGHSEALWKQKERKKFEVIYCCYLIISHFLVFFFWRFILCIWVNISCLQRH